MSRKRAVVLGMTVIMTSFMFVMPVSAHGHHNRQAVCVTETDRLCQVCTEEGCVTKGWHIHDGETYCGYAHTDGYCDGTCDTARVCTVEACTETGHHIHDGRSYCGYAHESGYCDGTCNSVTVCTQAGCTQTGQHTHDGETYCGYAHSSGYCDHSCEQTRNAGSGRQERQGRHHGHHA